MCVFLGVTEDVVVVGALVPEEALEEGEFGFAMVCFSHRDGVCSGLSYVGGFVRAMWSIFP